MTTAALAIDRGDFDESGVVDTDDFTQLRACMIGPDSPTDQSCRGPDHDADNDVDLNDLARFQRVFGADYPCPPEWTDLVTTGYGANGGVLTFARFEDGHGESLIVGGDFTNMAGVQANNIARWDGASWSQFGNGLPFRVEKLASLDDGNGPVLYAGGYERFAKWNGSEWSVYNVGARRLISDFVVFDDGSGPSIYIGGSLYSSNFQIMNGIAKWDGYRLTSVGNPLVGWASALAVYDDGLGEALYAAGYFSIDGVEPKTQRLLKWNGSNWKKAGGRVDWIQDLDVFDDGSGPALFATGQFSAAGRHAANGVAKFDGAFWSSVGDGPPGTFSGYASLVLPGDSGSQWLVAGRTLDENQRATTGVFRWDGATWSHLGTDFGGNVYALGAIPKNTDWELLAGGRFTSHEDPPALNIARWNQDQWSSIKAAPVPMALDGPVYDLVTFDDGAGPALIVSGSFNIAGNQASSHVAKWTPTTGWTRFGCCLNGDVFALKVADLGSGPALFAGGLFNGTIYYGDPPLNGIAQWDGSSWRPLGFFPGGLVRDMLAFDDGTGRALYVAGQGFIAKWDGASWSDVGEGLDLLLYALESYDDGTGPALYAGSSPLRGPDGFILSSVNKWDGDAWTPLWGCPLFNVFSLQSFDDGHGPALFAGGEDFASGSFPESGIAKWDGSAWSNVGGGLKGEVWSLAVLDDGSGPALFASGYFGQTPDGLQANGLAKWDGFRWSPVNSPPGRAPYVLSIFDDGSRPVLVTGGGSEGPPSGPEGFVTKMERPNRPCE